MPDINNKNLSENQKNNAMEQAKKILAKMKIPLTSEAEQIMNSFLDGNISKSEAMKEAKEVKKNDILPH